MGMVTMRGKISARLPRQQTATFFFTANAAGKQNLTPTDIVSGGLTRTIESVQTLPDSCLFVCIRG
jgi:hypothetical protein